MKVVILAGGLPSIIGEENEKMPKPMVQIGERPILWHIMKLFSYYGFVDFIICTGYKSDVIKDYFLNYYIYQSDITVHLKTNEVEVHNRITENWNVSIVNTGLEASTGERLRIVAPMLDEDFVVTYGDCVSDIDVPKLMDLHRVSGKMMTVALARPTGRNAIIPTNDEGEISLAAAYKHLDGNAWVNACMMAVNPAVFTDDGYPGGRFEEDVMHYLAVRGEVNTYRHEGFWLPVETVRDRVQLQQMWDAGNAPWRVWND